MGSILNINFNIQNVAQGVAEQNSNKYTEEKIMKVFLVFWAIIVVIAIILIGVSTTMDCVYQGNDIKLKLEDRDIQIETTSVKIEIEGVSGDYFQLKKSDEILYSIPKAAPLGYEGKDYFVLEKQPILEGRWDLKQGQSIDIQLKSDENMIVTTICNNKFVAWLGICFLGVLAWFSIAGMAFAISES